MRRDETAIHGYSPDEFGGLAVPLGDHADLQQIRCHYPELCHWSDVSLWDAWGMFSQDIHMVGWHEPCQRTMRFLQYLIFLQTEGSWHNGLPGDLDEIQLLE